MTLVAGIDSSTQSCKVVVCDADTGEVLRQGAAAHPDGTEVDPAAWWEALATATAGGLLEGVEAISVGGQQHGTVLLDEAGDVVRPALLWNDLRSAAAAAHLVAELGGAQPWADAVGSVPVASFTVTKLRWLAEHEPEAIRRATHVVLPHDWLTARLTGAAPSTDRGDASGTGYWSAESGWRPDLLRLACGRDLGTPTVLAPTQPAGTTAAGILVAAGTGDNMAAALGLSLRAGDTVVSLGTSGTAFAAHPDPVRDPSGAVAGFADATGGFLPLVCTLNAARVLTTAAALIGTDLDGLAGLALAAPAGAGGLVLIPYLDGERTPDLPHATGTLTGLTRDTMTPGHLARAAVEGMLCGLADAVDALTRQGVVTGRIVLIGGAARSAAVQSVAATLFGVPVVVPAPGEYVARGAARQAAWALAGADDPPGWEQPGAVSLPAVGGGSRVRAAYAAARDAAVAGQPR